MANVGTVPLHLLLIDDDPMFRYTVGTLLRRIGHRVEEAESGAAGLDLLRKMPVDLVLTDLRMPGMTGWEVARLTKMLHPSVPVVLVTGSAASIVPDLPERQYVDAILEKPCGAAQLQAVFRTLSAARVAAA